MLTLIITILCSLGIGYFATQNTTPVTIHLYTQTWIGIPLYIVIVGSLLAGLFMAGIISFVNYISSQMTLHGKDSKLKETKELVTSLTKNLHQLELENARLKAHNNDEPLDDEKTL